jgi:lipopolysaccharide transport system permease protein
VNASYLQPEVRLDAADRAVHAEFELRNDSPHTWRAAEGFAVGYHLFDAESGTLIVDGARVHAEGDVAPGETVRVKLDVPVPEENGRYQVLLSPMREDVCWYYEQGWPFLLVETATEEGASRVERVRVATAATLRRERIWRSLGRAFVLPFRTTWRNRGLIRVMVRRDVLGRYRGSFGGAFWTVIHPLLLILTYFFVFGMVLRSRFGADTSSGGFALYLLAGMLPWLAFSEAAGRAPTVMLEHRNFVKKLVFAVETLPVNLVAAGLVTELFAVLLYCGFIFVMRGGVPATVAWLPIILIPQVLFTAGLAWFLAALGVFVRDLGQIIGFVLTLWFFLTPICYPETQWDGLPHAATAILSRNPIFVLVRSYRAIFLEHHAPPFGALAALSAIGLLVFIAGHAWFYKLRKSFPDLL